MVRYILLNITQPFNNLTHNPSKKVRITEKLDIAENGRFTKISVISSVNCILYPPVPKTHATFLLDAVAILCWASKLPKA